MAHYRAIETIASRAAQAELRALARMAKASISAAFGTKRGG
jgi:hypothetical protein